MPRPKKRRPHKAGQVYQRGTSTWSIRWREHGVRRSMGGFIDRPTAELALAKVLADAGAARVGAKPVHRGPLPTLATLFDSWNARRKLTHRSAAEDFWRWQKHLEPVFGKLTPSAVDAATLRRFIEDRLAAGLSSTTCRLLVAELSGLFTDAVEQGIVSHNPLRDLPRSTRRLIRPAHDTATTPYLEKLADVRRVFAKLPPPTNIMFAIGALAGLRVSEILALRWAHVDMAARRIHVREGKNGRLKTDKSRIVPILDPLLPVLAAWKLEAGGSGDARVVPPMRDSRKPTTPDSREPIFDPHTARAHLRDALVSAKLPALTFYQATRHTFASAWVANGGSLEKLRVVLGHSTPQMTLRYAHLAPAAFEQERGLLDISLAPAKVARIRKGGAR